MKSSEDISKLSAALVAAQSAMGAAVKGSENPFFKSSYADLGAVVKAIKEPFSANGLAYVQFPVSSEQGIGVTTRLVHSSGQWLEQDYFLPLAKRDPQAAGSAITYARRYALQAMAGIPTADDDAEAAMMRVAPKITDTQAQQLRQAIDMAGISERELCAKVHISRLEDLEASRFDGAVKHLQTLTQKDNAA